MREIKFRAWDKENTIMLFFSFIDDTSDYPIDFPENNLSESNKYVIMQYTGLKDKNSKEIYEGDIVKWRDSLFTVAWDEPCALFILRRIKGDNGMKEIPSHNLANSEVIGNIYENPELLESKKGNG